MGRWETRPLGELCDTASGGTPSRGHPEYFGGSIPWVKSGELRDSVIEEVTETITQTGLENSSAKIFPKGTLLIALYGATVAQLGLLARAAATNQAVCAIFPNENILQNIFLFYCLLHNREKLIARCVGGAQPNISQEIVRSIPVPLPPLLEQERIVKLLDQADTLRKLRAEADRRAGDLIPALFHEMFGDPARNSHGAPIVRLSELVEIPPNYGTMIPARANGGEWLCLRVANIQDGALDLTDRKFVNLPDELLKRHTVKDGDLLLARAIGSEEHLGKCVVVHPGEDRWAFDSHLMRVRFKGERCKPDWVKALFDSPGGRQLFLSNTRKSAVQFNINSKEFGNIAVPLPPVEEQQSFWEYVTKIRALQAEQARSRLRLDDLFQSMLHRAFSGEL